MRERRNPIPTRIEVLVFVSIPLACLLAACQTEVERLQAESQYHLKHVVEILESTAGNTDAALAELDKYAADNRDRLLEIRARGMRLVREMSPEDRERFGRKSLERVKPLRERIETLARTFPNPPLILSKVQQFL